MIDKTFPANVYVPTQPRTGEAQPTLLRLGNLILTGVEGRLYLQCYAGTLDLDETIPAEALTGTIDIAADSKNVAGKGTAFKTELRSGQYLFVIDGFLLIVDQITDDTHCTIYKAPTDPIVAATAQRMPVLFNIQNQRGTLIQGDAVESDKGTIIGAGFGTLRINGVVLAGDSMVLGGSPKKGIFDSATGLYAVSLLGFDTPTISPSVASVVGGTHNMQPGNFSLRLVPSSTITNGYGNPGPQVPFTIANAGERAEVDFSSGPAMDTAKSQNAWDFYGSENIDSVPVWVQGPWNFIRTVTAVEIAAGTNKVFIEYANAEINRLGLLDFNNDPPPPCGYVAFLEGGPVYISCRGKLSDTFGPSIRPGKPQNIEAAPADWDVSATPPQNILGYTSSLARLYFPTPSSLQQGIYIGSTDPFQIVPSVSMRPYWRVGFNHGYQLIFIGQDLFGYPHQGPTRSAADSEGVAEQYFGQQVAELTKNWNSAQVLVGEDPQLGAVCFFHSADSLNDDGFWRTRVLIWGIEQNGWIGDVYISSDARDMIVCGLTTVNERLQFLAGGRLDAGVQVDTFQFNTPSGDPIEWYAAWSGLASPDRNIEVRAARVTGKCTAGVTQVFGYDEDVDIDYAELEAGTNPLIQFDMSGTATGVQRKFRQRFVAPNCGLAILRASGTWDSIGDPDRIDGGYMAGLETGNRR